MKLHEYQAKALLQESGVPVPDGRVARTPAEAERIAAEIGCPVMVKAQVLVGGRGKAGGVKMASDPKEAGARAAAILGMKIKGIEVQQVLVARAVDISSEYYVSLTVNRAAKSIQCIASASGGMEIEEIAVREPQKIIRFDLDPERGLIRGKHFDLLARAFPPQAVAEQAWAIVGGMHKLFVGKDCSLVEINPCALTPAGTLVAADAKVIFDDNALYRHPELEKLRSPEEYGEDEMDAKSSGLVVRRPGRDHRVHRQRGRSFHGHHGSHQVLRRQPRELPGRRRQLEPGEGAQRPADHHPQSDGSRQSSSTSSGGSRAATTSRAAFSWQRKRSP